LAVSLYRDMVAFRYRWAKAGSRRRRRRRSRVLARAQMATPTQRMVRSALRPPVPRRQLEAITSIAGDHQRGPPGFTNEVGHWLMVRCDRSLRESDEVLNLRQSPRRFEHYKPFQCPSSRGSDLRLLSSRCDFFEIAQNAVDHFAGRLGARRQLLRLLSNGRDQLRKRRDARKFP